MSFIKSISPGYASDEGPDCLNKYEYGFIGVLILTLCLSLLAIYLVSAKLIHIIVSTTSYLIMSSHSFKAFLATSGID